MAFWPIRLSMLSKVGSRVHCTMGHCHSAKIGTEALNMLAMALLTMDLHDSATEQAATWRSL